MSPLPLSRILLLLILSAAGNSQAQCLDNTPEPAPFFVPLDSASIISRVQEALIAGDLYQGIASGHLDKATTQAIEAVQKQQGLFVDGALSEALLALLLYQPTLDEASLHRQSGQPKGRFEPPEPGDAEQVNRVDLHGWTPLHYASLSGSRQRVVALLKSGAEVDAASPYGTTPLMIAVQMNRPQVVRELLKYEPRLGAADHRGVIAEEIAFSQKRNGLLKQFQRKRNRMLGARLGRRPPFRLRMVTWDEQECFIARKSRLPVDCDVQPECRMQRNQVILCDDRGEKLQEKIAQVVHRTWGGKPEVLDGRGKSGTDALACAPDDVMLIGIRH